MHPDDMTELRAICREIVGQDKSTEAWRASQSDDEFQTEHFCGGYEALEDAFCFSYYSRSEGELWFQVTTEEVRAIASGTLPEVSLRPAE